MIRQVFVCISEASYHYNIQKRVEMFRHLNGYRGDRPRWAVESVRGEELIRRMSSCVPRETLFVMPAGESTKFDQFISGEQIHFLQDFFTRGGKGYFTCGAAYWASRKRIYHGICETQPELHKTVEKLSRISLFQGTAMGPLCPFPAKQFRAGFYSDAVQVTDGKRECTIFVSGGGSFIPDPDQPSKVLVRYSRSELQRLGKADQLENAVVLANVGDGAVLLSMFHPYYGADDINVEAYEEAFYGSGTNWREVHARLSPHDERMQFVYESMIKPLEG